jgi:KDO2-lipid IV(A) lauroyltransferase
MTRVAVFFMWLLHWLPLPALGVCGRLFGRVLFRFGHARRHIALTNLGLCFPDLPEREKSALARRHFEAFGRAFVERGLLWWGSADRIRRIVHISGMERLDALRGRPTILLAPHFVGLDMGLTRLTLELPLVCIYANQKNPVFNRLLYRGRTRFGDAEMFSRQEGIRPAIKSMKAGKFFYYLPDLDYGRRDTIFVPFFGVPAATITGLSRLARMTGAVIVPAITRMTAHAYVVEIGIPWERFPGASIEDDTRRMNAFIESEILQMPEQYFWLHKRFKTRPSGEQKLY